MTILKFTVPDRLAREAEAAGLLTQQSITRLLKDAMRRRAAQELIAGAERASAALSKPMSMNELQREVNAVRAQRKVSKRA